VTPSTEQEGIAWALIFLFGVIVVALIDIHMNWAGRVERRQDDLERRIGELERERHTLR
jgi:hypothetical protein